MSKVLRFGLLVLLSIFYPTTGSKSAFQRATENDVKFHKPPSKNHVPLAYQKIGTKNFTKSSILVGRKSKISFLLSFSTFSQNLD